MVWTRNNVPGIPLTSSPSHMFNNLSVHSGFLAYARFTEAIIAEIEGESRIVSTPLHERTDVYQVAFITVKGASFLAVASSNAFQLYDITGRQSLFSYQTRVDRESSSQVHFFRGIAATPQALVVVGSSIGQLLVFEMLQDSTPESLVLLHEIQVAACPIVCCCADEVFVVCACDDGTLVAYRIQQIRLTECCRFPSEPTMGPCTSVCMRGGVAIASFASGHLQVYRLEINELLMCIAAHTRAITQICLHPSQPLVAVCSEDQHISVWSVPDLGSCGALELSLLYTDVVEHCLFTGVAFVRDGSSKIIAIGYDKETLMVWARD